MLPINNFCDLFDVVGNTRYVCAIDGTDEGRVEHRLNDTGILAWSISNQPQNVVWDVTRVVLERPRSSMGPDARRFRDVDGLPHRRVGRM